MGEQKKAAPIEYYCKSCKARMVILCIWVTDSAQQYFEVKCLTPNCNEDGVAPFDPYLFASSLRDGKIEGISLEPLSTEEKAGSRAFFAKEPVTIM